MGVVDNKLMAADPGIHLIMNYYKKHNKICPSWICHRMNNLPRYGYHKSMICVYANDLIRSDNGEVFDWIISELFGKWFCEAYGEYYFEQVDDAMAFKLRWS